MKTLVRIFIIIAILSSVEATYAASLVISSSGNGVFTLQGFGLTDVGGIDATISYDTSTLSNPRVVQGGLIAGAVMVTNPNLPGSVRIAAVKNSAISGSGAIATISFDSAAAGSGKILSLNARVINTGGKPLDVQTQVVNPSSDTSSPDTSTASSGLGQRYLGPTGADLPSGTGDSVAAKASPGNYQQDQTPPVPAATTPAETPADARRDGEISPVTPPAPSILGKTVSYKSVLDAFREYKGKRTLKALTALFDKSSIPGVRQEPAIVLSDGKTRVSIIVRTSSTGKEAPNFAVKHAKLLSLKPVGNTWTIEMLPDKNAFDSSVTMLDNGSMSRIPLAVAPPMEVNIGKIDAAGDVEIKSLMAGKKKPADKKGTSAPNYMEEYVFTANYKVRKNSAPASKTDVKYQKKSLSPQDKK